MSLKKLHFGPGKHWRKPSPNWLAVDIDSARGDICVNLNNINKLPFADNSITCIYAAHFFEHLSIFAAQRILRECYRVLMPDGYIRIVLPDVCKSIDAYIGNNREYELFQRREKCLKRMLGQDRITLFELLRADFLSPSNQPDLLGQESLAHQNAWDTETIIEDMARAGFGRDKIKQKQFQESDCLDFAFEGNYESEANAYWRSIYVEARK